MRRTLIAAALVTALAAATAAQAKFRIQLSLSDRIPAARQAVRATIHAERYPGANCSMRLVAVAPGVSIYDALDAFVLGGGSSFHRVLPSPRLGFLARTARVGRRTWRATIRFPRAGRWRLVVPNWCAPGYALPPPIVRVVVVRVV